MLVSEVGLVDMIDLPNFEQNIPALLFNFLWHISYVNLRLFIKKNHKANVYHMLQ